MNNPDPLDQATQHEENQRAISEKAVRARAAPEQVQNKDGSWPVTECIDCGSDIGEGRLELGKVRCIRCQELKDRKDKLYGRT